MEAFNVPWDQLLELYSNACYCCRSVCRLLHEHIQRLKKDWSTCRPGKVQTYPVTYSESCLRSSSVMCRATTWPKPTTWRRKPSLIMTAIQMKKCFSTARVLRPVNHTEIVKWTDKRSNRCDARKRAKSNGTRRKNGRLRSGQRTAGYGWKRVSRFCKEGTPQGLDAEHEDENHCRRHYSDNSYEYYCTGHLGALPSHQIVNWTGEQPV
ncbi:uncharacterized protein LOC124407033 isoform X2 [Diprion similis]|uniref:uncharacterized protein LOC124407033 isoform X2 n=1 Tax=Diprion similis TaxID=362088 RepID=UPI001EF823A9|nr:uncharacterized protein LOC124407033 isoform X2 [Diprion similis]